ncbi:hypothetical protein [Pseudoalteromonas phenolica]|uniref:hypothetical protein n=1 Tax=Pseudoalteromonas phenolica TaxID=161398 RepID=UPI001F0CF5B5|nr:hypothetical protein [Pseudoalteromonas phenolica]
MRTKPDRAVVNRAENIYQKLNSGNSAENLTAASWSLPTQMMAIIVAFYLVTMMLTSLPTPWNYILETVLSVAILAFTHKQLAPIRALSEKAKQVYDNPLMQKIYLGKVNDIAAIELALIARESELRLY